MIHIMPINDIKPHDELTTCECRPKIQLIENGEIMVIHNSYDGREREEELFMSINSN